MAKRSMPIRQKHKKSIQLILDLFNWPTEWGTGGSSKPTFIYSPQTPFLKVVQWGHYFTQVEKKEEAAAWQKLHSALCTLSSQQTQTYCCFQPFYPWPAMWPLRDITKLQSDCLTRRLNEEEEKLRNARVCCGYTVSWAEQHACLKYEKKNKKKTFILFICVRQAPENNF